ncbi:hypothetical protein E4U47_001158 [Claviceps purpurea]|nr:hypothetical protein E4U47_001158 [Claviceps purpurea]
MVRGIFAGLIVQAALAVSAPADKRWNCATVWGQCGGKDWTGTRCCSKGSVCIAQNPWYSQCLPRSQTVACKSCPHPTVSMSPASSVSSFTARVTTPVRSAATSSVTYTADDPFTDTETDYFDDGYFTDMEPDPVSSVAPSSVTRSAHGPFTYTKSVPARTAVTTSVRSTVTGTARGSSTKTAPGPVYTSDDDDGDIFDTEPDPFDDFDDSDNTETEPYPSHSTTTRAVTTTARRSSTRSAPAPVYTSDDDDDMTDIDFDPVYDSDDDSYITESYPGRTTTTRAATTTARRSSTRSAPAPVYTSDDDDDMTDIDFDPVYDSDDDSYITESYPGRTTTTRAATTTARRSSTRSAPAPVYTSDDDDTTDVEIDPVYGSDDDSNATDFEPGPYITETKSRPTRTAVTSYVTTYVTSTIAGSVASSFSLPPNCFCTEPARRPVYSSATSSVTSSAPAKASGSAAWKGNPYSGVDIWLNTDYASSIRNRAIPRLAGAMATAAEKVAKTPAFYWMDSLSKTPVMKKMLADIRAANRKGGNYAGQFVVYDLPDRDCAAAASSGEFTIRNDGVAKYKNYIDTIRKIVLAYSDVRIMLIIEPDSLSNMVTNLNIAKCSKAKSAYLEGVNYALRQLNLPNVAMYLDAGHAGWLGWPANQDSAAQLFAKVYKDAGSPSSLRGLVTNVANYNGWDTATPPRYTTGNAIYDEKHYIHALSPLLERHGWAGARFITDQGRAGKQPTGQTSWSHWCNAKGTGFGLRPSANTGDALLDAFVWVKPGGESDGTSKTSSRRYDYHCGFEDALKPAPEAGEWFHEHFVQLLRNANPPFL